MVLEEVGGMRVGFSVDDCGQIMYWTSLTVTGVGE